MAAVTVIRGSAGHQRIRTAAAQANTGQTDWVSVPVGAEIATVRLTVTAVAGTTPLARISSIKSMTPNLFAVGTANANKADDALSYEIAATTGDLSAAGTSDVQIGVGFTEDLAGPDAKVDSALPDILGITVLLDRGTADETYTYTLDVVWSPN